jgi:hypothetical protein
VGYLILNTDFIGKYKISQSTFTTEDLNNFISQYEKKYLYDLLGKTLADLFIADLVNYVPVDPIYLDVYNEINKVINGCLRISDGLKNMILGFIYFEYMRKSPVKSGITGNTVNVNENSISAGFMHDIYGRYNESINNYHTIQMFCLDDPTTYPDFDGVRKSISHYII